MNYKRVTIATPDEAAQEILIAQLAELGYEGFEQNEGSLAAYIDEGAYDKAALEEMTGSTGYGVEDVAQQNWNAVWESNFEPVVVEGLCTIRADFHNIEVNTPYEIVITPKMSFGTGHHATTQLMLMGMSKLDMKSKHVLDFGTGTGVLAIMAELLGAADILAIDYDEWAVENSRENVARNHCSHIKVEQNATDQLPKMSADVILANINRHVLLQFMKEMYSNLVPGGTLLLSGILVEDISMVTEAAIKEGFQPAGQQSLNNWAALSFSK